MYRTFIICSSPLVHSQKIHIGIPPWILVLHQKSPYIIIRPIFHRWKYQFVCECRIRAQELSDPLFFQICHCPISSWTLLLSGSQHEDDLSMFSYFAAYKVIDWLNLKPVRTPAILHPRKWVSSANQIHPECIVIIRYQSHRNKRDIFCFRLFFHLLQWFFNPFRHNRWLYQRICIHDMDSLISLTYGKLLNRHPHKLNRSCAVFSSGVANHPGNIIR